MKSLLCTVFLFTVLFSLIVSQEGEWNYDDDDDNGLGPLEWSNLNTTNTCDGANQSPIAIEEDDIEVVEPTNNIQLNFPDSVTLLASNLGYTLSFSNNDVVGDITGGLLEDEEFDMIEMHIHFSKNTYEGSEHSIYGKKFPLELHMVHFNRQYNTLGEVMSNPDGIAVLTTMFEIGDSNSEIEKIVENIENVEYKGDTTEIADLNLRNLLPENVDEYFLYSGSLTTPQCSEVVRFLIMHEPLTISESQLEKIQTLKKLVEGEDSDDDDQMAPNFRPIQERNSRNVFSTNKVSSSKYSSSGFSYLYTVFIVGFTLVFLLVIISSIIFFLFFLTALYKKKMRSQNKHSTSNSSNTSYVLLEDN